MIAVKSPSSADLFVLESLITHTPCDWSVMQLRDSIAEKDAILIVTLDDTLAGFICVRQNKFHWEILQLVVDKHFHRQHCATALVTHLIASAKNEKIESLQLEVRRSNAAAIGLYRKMGFSIVGERRGYYPDGEDAILATKLLAPLAKRPFLAAFKRKNDF